MLAQADGDSRMAAEPAAKPTYSTGSAVRPVPIHSSPPDVKMPRVTHVTPPRTHHRGKAIRRWSPNLTIGNGGGM